MGPIKYTTNTHRENQCEVLIRRRWSDELGTPQTCVHDATPADLISAIRSMGEEERAQLFGAFAADVLKIRTCSELTAATQRAEKAERERESARLGAGLLTQEIDTLRRERDEARLDAGNRQHEMDVARRQLGAQPAESIPGALGRLRAERDTLRARVAELVSAPRLASVGSPMPYAGSNKEWFVEAAAAKTQPADAYPLAPGSRWEGDAIVDRYGWRAHLDLGGSISTVRCMNSGGDNVPPYLADVLALAHRAGLLPAPPRWVPVGERLPEKDRRVVVPTRSGWCSEVGPSIIGSHSHWLDWTPPPLPGEVAAPEPVAVSVPVERIDPERLVLVQSALQGYVDQAHIPEDAAEIAVDVADAALAILRGKVAP